MPSVNSPAAMATSRRTMTLLVTSTFPCRRTLAGRSSTCGLRPAPADQAVVRRIRSARDRAAAEDHVAIAMRPQRGEVIGQELVVGVEEGDPVVAGRADRGVARRCASAVDVVADHRGAGGARRGRRAIARAVVDDEHLGRWSRPLVERAAHGPLHHRRAVVRGNHDGDRKRLWHGFQCYCPPGPLRRQRRTVTCHHLWPCPRERIT